MINNINTMFFELNLNAFTLFAEYLIAVSALYFLVLLTTLRHTVWDLNIQKAVSESIAVILLMSCYLIYNDDILFLQSLSFNSSIINGSLTFFAKFLTCFFSATFFFIIADFLEDQKLVHFEYLLILLFAVLGLLLLCSSYDLLTSYLSIELISLSSYLLAAFRKDSFYSIEAGLKYFIVGSVSSAFFLLGSSFIYACSGSISFSDLWDLFNNKLEYAPVYLESSKLYENSGVSDLEEALHDYKSPSAALLMQQLVWYYEYGVYWREIVANDSSVIDLEEALLDYKSQSAALLMQQLAWYHEYGVNWQEIVNNIFAEEQHEVFSNNFFQDKKAAFSVIDLEEAFFDYTSPSAVLLMQQLAWYHEYGVNWQEIVSRDSSVIDLEEAFLDYKSQSAALLMQQLAWYHEYGVYWQEIVANDSSVIDLEEALIDYTSPSAALLMQQLAWYHEYGVNWQEIVNNIFAEEQNEVFSNNFFQDKKAAFSVIDLEEAFLDYTSPSAVLLMQQLAWYHEYGVNWQEVVSRDSSVIDLEEALLDYKSQSAALLMQQLAWYHEYGVYWQEIVANDSSVIDLEEALLDYTSPSAVLLMQQLAWYHEYGVYWQEIVNNIFAEEQNEVFSNNFFQDKKAASSILFDINSFRLLQIGVSFILFSIFIKLALAPFHLWSLDVYEGSPTSSTFFFAVITKLSFFIFLIRFCYVALFSFSDEWQFYLICVSLISVFVGSIGGVTQHRLKTLLAYSSVSHMGYAMLALCTVSLYGIQMVLFYLTIYTLSGVCTWHIIMLLKLKAPNDNNKKYSKELTDLALLSKANPALAFALTITMFSLAGLPPFIGFIAKLGVFMALLNEKFYFVCVFSMLCSVISTFYYIRVIKIMYFENTLVGKLYYPIRTNKVILLSAFTFMLVFLFINPNLLFLVIQDVVYSSLV